MWIKQTHLKLPISTVLLTQAVLLSVTCAGAFIYTVSSMWSLRTSYTVLTLLVMMGMTKYLRDEMKGGK